MLVKYVMTEHDTARTCKY